METSTGMEEKNPQLTRPELVRLRLLKILADWGIKASSSDSEDAPGLIEQTKTD